MSEHTPAIDFEKLPAPGEGLLVTQSITDRSLRGPAQPSLTGSLRPRCPGRRTRGSRGNWRIRHSGRSVPDCSATMYDAYQAGQSSSWFDRWNRCEPPLDFSCSRWAASARRSAPSKFRRGHVARLEVVHPAGEPGRDLLDQPRVAVGIAEVEERSVAGALGIGARLACLDRERRAMPDVADLDAAADEFVTGRLDVGDDQPALGRAGRSGRESLAESDRGPGAAGCELDDAKSVHRGVVALGKTSIGLRVSDATKRALLARRSHPVVTGVNLRGCPDPVVGGAR